MTLALIKRDPVFRSLGPWLVLASMYALAPLGFFSVNALQNQEVDPRGLVWFLWTAVGLYFWLGKVDQRCGDLDMVLPVSARHLWTVHVAALVVGGGLILVAAAFSILFAWFAGWRIPTLGADALGTTALHLGAGLLLTVALLQSGRPGVRQPVGGLRGHLWRLLVLVGVAALMGALVTEPLYLVLVPLAAAAALIASTYRAVPAAFTLAGTDLSAGTRTFSAAWTSVPRRSLFRILAKIFFEPRFLFTAAFLPPFGMVLGGAMEAAFPGLTLRYQYAPWAVYFLLAPGTMLVQTRLHLVDALPISRRKIFASLVGAILALLVLGYGGVQLAVGFSGLGGEVAYTFEPRVDSFSVSVPARHWQIAWDGQAPANTAPWGETHEAGREALFRGLRVHLYSPFSTPEGSSPEFVAWQLSRAVEAVYGREVPPRELRERYLEEEGPGRIYPKHGLHKLHDDYGARPRPAGPVFPVIFLLIGPAWLVCLGVFLRFCRAGAGPWRRQAVLFAAMALWPGLMWAELAMSAQGLGTPWAIRGFLEILILRLGTSPLTTLLVWVTSAAVFAATYLWARREFDRIEIDTKTEKK